MRLISCICAESIRSGNPEYVNAAERAFHVLVGVSFRMPDGAIFTPISMDADGSPGVRSTMCRPSDTGIIIRGLIAAAKTLLHFGQEKRAKVMIGYAWDYAKVFFKMQDADGSFYERYHYPDCRPAQKNKGTVNNWTLQLWNLCPLLRFAGMAAEADEVMNLIDRSIESQLNKTPSILEVAGGGEDHADFGDALNTAATLLAMKYCRSGKKEYRDYALQAIRKSWLLSCMWADMPGLFSLYGNSDLGVYYDQPRGMFSSGGMHTLTAGEACLFCADVLNSKMALDFADAMIRSRLSSFYLDNGGIVMVNMRCPNYHYVNTRLSEGLMYGDSGVRAFWEAERESAMIAQILSPFGNKCICDSLDR